MTEGHLDLGKVSAKYTNTDELLALMRRVVRDLEGQPRSAQIKAWLDLIHESDDYESEHLPTIERYVANAYWRRCVALDDESTRPAAETKAKAKEIIEAGIVLWTWRVPTINKPLSDCTFQEVGEAAPLAGRFLRKLAEQGAPGTLVKEVFRTKRELQDFWKRAQSA